MGIRWGDIKTRISEGMIKDPTGKKYTDDQWIAWARWALIEVSFHTAELASKLYAGDGEKYQFPLPSDLLDYIEDTGLVGLQTADEIRYLNSMRREPGSLWPWPLPEGEIASSVLSVSGRATNDRVYGFWEYPAGVLALNFIPASTEKILLYYFKVWTPPETDDSILGIPMWLERPFAYYVAASAMDPKAVQASDIRQWNDKSSSGNPEDNPLIKQAEFFLKRAKDILALHRPQNRETFYKERLNE